MIAVAPHEHELAVPAAIAGICAAAVDSAMMAANTHAATYLAKYS
jgi:hypothetical protein